MPHIYGPTDVSAQAEDNFWQLAEDYIVAIGRSAEVYGPSRLRRFYQDTQLLIGVG